jgi:hypothetical protein
VRSDRRVSVLGTVVMVAFGLAMAACSDPKSYVVLTLQSETPEPILDVTKVVVVVSQNTATTHMTKTLVYPAAHITIDQVTKTDLSVSFTGVQSGTVDLLVTVWNGAGCTVGSSSSTTHAVINRGGVGKASVVLSATNDCAQADGGRDALGDAFPGCDPVNPLCGTGQTCQVNCMANPKVAECVPGGSGAPGTPCQKNSDCRPGSQCFDYSTTGCNVKLCLRFCNDDEGCGTAIGRSDAGVGDGGVGDTGAGQGEGGAGSTGSAVGTSSLCMGPVQCGAVVTAYRTCTFACDPRQTAVTASGCPTGLACLVVVGMDQVDCACPEKTRVGTDGVDCTGSVQCAPGFICNRMGAIQKCRAVCRCDASLMKCNAPNDCKAQGTSCVTLTNDTIFGVCM